MLHGTRTLVVSILITLLTACGGGGGGGGGGDGGNDTPPPVISYFAYVANAASNDISAYALDSATGALTPIDADSFTTGIQNFPAGATPQSVTLDPAGRFVYVANGGSHDISAYSLNVATGALTPVDADAVTPGMQNIAAGNTPQSVTVDPTGRFVYAANKNSNNVSAYTRDAITGALTPIDADAATAGIQNFPAGNGAQSVTCDSAGKFVYVANGNSSGVSAYTVNTTTGFLTRIDGDAATAGIQDFPAGALPQSVTFDPASKFGFVPNSDSHDISAYTLNTTTGALTRIDADVTTAGIQDFAAGNSPLSAAVDPAGKFVYVANSFSHDISAYTINATTGALTPLDADAVTAGIQNFPAGGGPVSITTDSMGKFVYVANNISNDVSAYTLDPTTGALTPIDADAVTAGVQNFPAGNRSASIVTARTVH